MKRLALVLAAGCSSGPRAGAPTTAAAAPAQLTQIQLAAADGAKAICPGTPFQLLVTGADKAGQRLATPTSYRKGVDRYEDHGLPWQRFQLTASVGSFTPAAMFAAPANIVALAEATSVEITAKDLAQPSMTAQLTMPLDFGCGGTFRLHGDPGMAGANGGVGSTGGLGGQVQIRIGRLNTRAHGLLILARVDSVLGRSYFLLQPGGAALVVDLTGGDGGRGGQGVPPNDPKASYGPPGPGASGGMGGTANIRVDANDPLLAQAVKVYNPGGIGGFGGLNPFGGTPGAHGPQGPAGPLPLVSYEDPAVLFADEIAQGFPIAVPQVAAQKR